MRIATWNVLHRIHAVNWAEPAIEAQPDEAARVGAIVALIEDLGDIVCLQEVSGDQLAVLRAAMPDATVVAHAYPRVPRLFRPGPTRLSDPTEHLVTISRLPIRTTYSRTFESDRGKGFLLVEATSGAVAINTHVSYGEHHAAQCLELVNQARPFDRVAIVGDFNCDRATCIQRLGPRWVAASPREPALPTRPRAIAGDKSQTIDHVFVTGLVAEHAAVLDGHGLSDHNPVVAVLG